MSENLTKNPASEAAVADAPATDAAVTNAARANAAIANAAASDAPEAPHLELNPEARIAGAAAFAAAESAEILNLLGDQGGQCCGGSCGCSV